MIKTFLQKFSGTLQDDEKKKCQNQKALLMYARELDITWGDIDRYWKWYSVREKSGSFEVAELMEGPWFEVSGNFDSTNLAPDTKYEVVFLTKMKSSADGWEKPVKLELTLPYGQRTEYEKNFFEIPPGMDKWLQLKIGEFRTPQPGKVEFSVKNSNVYWRKRGVLVKGVLVRSAAGSNS